MSEGTPPPPPPPENPEGGAPPPYGQTPPPAGPPGGYGAPPPPPPPPPGAPGGYGAAPPPPPAPPLGSGDYSPTDAFSYGWGKFKAKPGELLVPMLVVLVIVIVLEIVIQIVLRATLLGTHDCTTTIGGFTAQGQCGPGFPIFLLGTGIGTLLITLVQQSLGAGLIKNALHIADGRPASMSEIGTWAGNGKVIMAALIVALATFVGTLLCIIPGIIVGFLLNWTMFYVVDQGMEPMDAVKASIKFTTDNLGNTVVFYLLGIVAFVVGAILCLVGLLVAAPVVLIGAAFTFRRLNGQQVSPVA
jgi:uncharacterized membrane protein